MPEINLLHIGAATAAAIVGIVLGWAARGNRARREKSAINAGWQEQLEAKNVEGSRLATQNKELMEQVSHFQNSNQSAARQVKELSAALKGSEERRTRLERQVEGFRTQLNRATDDLNQLNIELKARPGNAKAPETIKAQKDKITSLKKTLDEWRSRMPPLVEKFRERDEMAKALEAELAEARQRIATLETDAKADNSSEGNDANPAVERRNNESESTVVSIAERNLTKASTAEAESSNLVEEDEVANEDTGMRQDGSVEIDSPGDADLLDAGENLDSQIEQAAAQEDDIDGDGEAMGGTHRVSDDPFAATFTGATDDDTGQARFDGGRTRFDPDSVFSPEDDEAEAALSDDMISEDELLEDDVPSKDDIVEQAQNMRSAGSSDESGETADQEASDPSVITEGPAVARRDGEEASEAGNEEPEAASADADGDHSEPKASGSDSVDFGAYVDYPDDEEGDGLRDNLKRVNGIGPAIEKTLNELGFFRYRQIADLTDYDIDRIGKRLKGFRARIYREDWMGQARDLSDQAAGETA